MKLLSLMRREGGSVSLTDILLIIVIVILVVVFFGSARANATHTEGPPECVTVVDEEGYTTEGPIQRYSYVGGVQGLDENGVPVQTTAPGSDWQANTTLYNDGTSHGGNLGLYFVSHGSSGNGDWFYWEVGIIEVPPVTHEECHDATSTPPPPTECPDSDVECPGWEPSWTPEPPANNHNVPPVGESPRENLAQTGGDLTAPTVIGAALMLAGLGALWLARRKMA